MKKKMALAICIISFLLIAAAVVWSLVYGWTHIDQTEMRQFVDNPYPTIMTIFGLLGFVVVKGLE